MGYSQTNNRLTKRAPDPEPPNGAGEHRDRLVGACPVPSGPACPGRTVQGTGRQGAGKQFSELKPVASKRLCPVPPGCRASRDTPTGTLSNYAGVSRTPLGILPQKNSANTLIG